MKRVAVLCPTRERPDRFAEMCKSALLHPLVDVLAYVDDDDPCLSDYFKLASERVLIGVDERVHPAASLNRLAKAHPEYDYFTMMVDDARYQDLTVINDGMMHLDWWEGIGVVHFDFGEKTKFLNFPMLSKRMVGVLGYFANPACTWYCYDTTMQSLGEAIGRIEMLGKGAIVHDNVRVETHRERQQHDFGMALMYYAFRFRDDLARLRKAMNERPEAVPAGEVSYA